jgi:hypothetical protein
MEFIVPKFIERELRIIGPLTLKQFLYLAAAGSICFILKYLAPFWVFLSSCFFLGGVGFALAFFRIGGRPLPIIIANFFKFSISPKLFIWKRKKVPIYFVTKEKVKEEGSLLPIGGTTQLKKIKTEIETKTK